MESDLKRLNGCDDMPDREKVVKGLTVCTKPGTKGCFYDMKECPYEENGCRVALMHDALALLKEQQKLIDEITQRRANNGAFD